ncbi:class I SAM-dependent methyltransferase [soil metagenome]
MRPMQVKPRSKRRSKRSHKPTATSWEPLARWYDGWVGPGGSRHHRELALPAVLELLDLRAGESLLDIGAGQGVLAPHASASGARYTGLDASPSLIRLARKRHGAAGRFLVGDARALDKVAELNGQRFDAAVFLLSIQDMDPLEEVLASASRVLEDSGRLVMLMTHPCFRVPRQSGWGWDEERKLRYRRVDRYLSPLAVPMKPYPGGRGVSRSFHRPLEAYINGLGSQGLLVECVREIAAPKEAQEIPLFLGLRARKLALEED